MSINQSIKESIKTDQIYPVLYVAYHS